MYVIIVIITRRRDDDDGLTAATVLLMGGGYGYPTQLQTISSDTHWLILRSVYGLQGNQL